jgi:hypothetical protein
MGSDLAPDRLKYIWIRAGGREKDLPHAEAPADLWLRASQMAHNGSLSYGLCSLLWGLGENFPNNPEVTELKGLICLSPIHLDQ